MPWQVIHVMGEIRLRGEKEGLWKGRQEDKIKQKS